MKLRIDLNADLGEGAGHDAELLTLVSSASIACAIHAGDPAAILQSLKDACNAGVAVGAHPSLNDRENFGRKELPVAPDEVFALVIYQVAALHALANTLGLRPNHVKPHGALYNMAVRDPALADAVCRAITKVEKSLLLFAPNDSALARAAAANGLSVTREVFADRNYRSDGSLVPRSRGDALLHDPEKAASRVLRMLREGVVRSVDGDDVQVRAETICLHGDTPRAVEFARVLRAQLEEENVVIEAPIRPP